MFDPELVSIVVRTVSPKRLPRLREAIASIYGNSYRPIEVVVVIQTEDDSHIEMVKTCSEAFELEGFSLKTVVNPTGEDQRARNLNLGMAVAQGRYVGFLDDDDLFYPNHVEALIAPLMAVDSASAWAFGDVALAQCHLAENGQIEKTLTYPFRREHFSLTEFFRQNVIPMHAFLLDRIKIDAELLAFDESFTYGEDYIFLLRLAARYCPAYIKIPVSEYRVFDDLSNSNTIMNDQLKRPDRAKIKAWNYALWRTEQIKEKLMPDYGIELLSLKRRKYLFYHLPWLKIFLRYRIPAIRRFLLDCMVRLKLTS